MVENHFANTYREIEIFQGNNVRKSIRYLALEFLSRWQRVINYNTPFHTPRIQFLYVHHVFKDEEIAFRKLLNFLQREHTFISYSEAVLRIKTGNIDKPYISISSDDGFKNNLNAARICNELGISACFFINPGLINENNYHKIKQHCNNKLQFLPVEFLTWDDVGTLKSNGHEIGSHTMFHDNVTHMSIEKFRIDCNQSRSLLMKHCGSADHFSFPYGRYASF
ncbi:MAG: polysaccharide deacetylase family protein [Bacteroidetes bacterium]|nr:polysaccharide deacetylase family protein [Bacteroidota bacterium]